MSREFVVRPAARLEILEAIDWYTERSREVGADFAEAVHAAFDAINQNPARYPEVDPPIRMAVLRPYPYTVLFTVDESELVVLSVFHVRRDPRHWKARS